MTWKMKAGAVERVDRDRAAVSSRLDGRTKRRSHSRMTRHLMRRGPGVSTAGVGLSKNAVHQRLALNLGVCGRRRRGFFWLWTLAGISAHVVGCRYRSARQRLGGRRRGKRRRGGVMSVRQCLCHVRVPVLDRGHWCVLRRRNVVPCPKTLIVWLAWTKRCRPVSAWD